jgi:hypothetical protein
MRERNLFSASLPSLVALDVRGEIGVHSERREFRDGFQVRSAFCGWHNW